MLIKLLPNQIPKNWELIKYAAVTADEVEEKDIGAYSIDLLFRLLNSKALCILSVSKERKVQRVLIVSFEYNTVTRTKSLFFNTLYGILPVEKAEWLEETAQICDFAKKEGCAKILHTTKNSVIMDYAEKYGFSECSKNYSIEI